SEPFAEVLYQAKSLICRASLSSEVNALARQINRVSEANRRSRDFTLNELRDAVREVIACFPVYRTYLRPDEPVAPRDRGYIEQAVARARRQPLDRRLTVRVRSGRTAARPPREHVESRASAPRRLRPPLPADDRPGAGEGAGGHGLLPPGEA